MSINGTLTYEISGSFTNILPIINTDNSFTILNSLIENNIVTVEYGYNEVINNDGLYLYNFNDYAITKIISFGSIPLSRQGNQFRDYQGTLPDDKNDTPTILNDTNGSYMFSRTVFSSGVGNWNVENITNLERAFERNPNFNEDLDNWNLVNLSGRMSNIFEECSSFNGNVSNWNVENVNNIQFAFSGCSLFNQPLNWNVSNITDMIALFEICIVFNQNLNGWDMSNVKFPGRMFNGCNSFNQPVNNWITSNFNDINGMFGSCSIFNQDLSSWDVSNVINMRNLFQNSTIFNQDLSSWNIEQVINMFNMLNNSGLSVDNYNATLNGWASQIVQPNIELGAQELEYSSDGEVGRNILINDYNWVIQGDVKYKGIFSYELSGTFNNNLPILNTDNSFKILNSTMENNTVTVEYGYIEIINNDGLYLYNFNDYKITKITSFGAIPLSRQGSQFRDYQGTFPNDTNDIPTILNDTNGDNIFKDSNFTNGINKWNTININSLISAFENNIIFNDNINNWNVSNVLSMENMFYNCYDYNNSINDWNISNVRNTSLMFSNCIKFNNELNNWNTQNITKMNYMFSNCSSFNKDISKWNLSNTINTIGMFSFCFIFNQNLSNWERNDINNISTLSNVLDMSYMFAHCNLFNGNINNWNIQNCINLYGVFYNCINFNQSLYNWNISKIIFDIENKFGIEHLFDNTKISISNYDLLLNNWSNQNNIPNDLILGVNDLIYSEDGNVGRNILIKNYNWTFIGDIKENNNGGGDNGGGDNGGGGGVVIPIPPSNGGGGGGGGGDDGEQQTCDKWYENGDLPCVDTKPNLYEPELTNNKINENEPPETYIGTFEFTGEIISNEVILLNNTDNFLIRGGNNLYSRVSFNFEKTNSYNINILAIAGALQTYGFYDIFINDINEKPTDIILSNNSINENEIIGTVIGELTTIDDDNNQIIPDSFIYVVNNNNFAINGNQLISNTIFDYETKNSYNIEITSIDTGDNRFIKQLTINILNINEIPTNITLSNNTIKEHKQVGTFIGTLKTEDVDSNTFTYYVNNNIDFAINGNQLISNTVFDYEIQNNYNIEITSNDGNNLLTQNFTIKILNIDEGLKPILPDDNEPICYLKDTKIIILKNNKEYNEKIQNLKYGDLVKTSNGEYKKIVFIGYNKLNVITDLYKLRYYKSNNNHLIITRAHSLLFDNLNNINKFYNKKTYFDNIYGYYKIRAYDCKLCSPVRRMNIKHLIENNNKLKYYHICLENEDISGQYGIYSNNILTETLPINFIYKSNLIRIDNKINIKDIITKLKDVKFLKIENNNLYLFISEKEIVIKDFNKFNLKDLYKNIKFYI